MHLTKRLRQNLLVILTVCVISVCVVFATAGAKITPDAAAQPDAPSAAETGAQAAVSQPQQAVKGVSQTRAAPVEARYITASLEYINPQGADQDAAEAVSEEVPAPETASAADEPAAEATDEAAQEQAASENAPPQDTAATDISVFLPLPEEQPPENAVYLDTFIATAYYVTGTTSTGTQTTVGRTLAVNPYMIPYGSHVWLYLEDGTLVGDFIAEDTGSNMLAHPHVIDIYMGADSYNTCILWGARNVLVYIEEPETETE